MYSNVLLRHDKHDKQMTSDMDVWQCVEKKSTGQEHTERTHIIYYTSINYGRVEDECLAVIVASISTVIGRECNLGRLHLWLHS